MQALQIQELHRLQQGKTQKKGGPICAHTRPEFLKDHELLQLVLFLLGMKSQFATVNIQLQAVMAWQCQLSFRAGERAGEGG